MKRTGLMNPEFRYTRSGENGPAQDLCPHPSRAKGRRSRKGEAGDQRQGAAEEGIEVNQHDLNRLCAAYRTFRAEGMTAPEAWRFALEYLVDQPTPRKK